MLDACSATLSMSSGYERLECRRIEPQRRTRITTAAIVVGARACFLSLGRGQLRAACGR
jgi:hypothetical protein